jgi:ABC-type nitrate/sulfonate/bicarbonate transport system permease component
MAAPTASRSVTARRRGRSALRWVMESALLLVVLVALWQLVTSVTHPLYFPTPAAIWGQVMQAWFTPSGFSTNILPSFERVTLGWLLAVVVGVPLGFAIGRVRGLGSYLTPLVHYGRAVPAPVVLPIFMIFFGIGNVMKVLFIAVGIIWPILLNTIKGVESVEALQLDTATVYGIRGSRRLLHVELPAALPDILAGVRISLALAFVLMVISEMIAASGGIGYQILQSQAQFDILNMWAGIVVLAVGGVVFNALLAAIEARVLRWHRGQRREAL